MVVARIDPHTLPAPVMQVCRALAAVAGRTWLVGGTVRDLLRAEQPRDFDLATDLTPDQVAAALPDIDRRDAAFGVCRLPLLDSALSITTLRRDGGYTDRRHPDAVEFVQSPEIDAQRRDFTVNAIYFEPLTGQFVDPTGGMEDLRLLVLRTVGPPARRFDEDALRLLRAVRFAARCGLTMHPATRAAAIAAAGKLASLSVERVFAELTDAFTSPGRALALRLFVETGAAAVLLPEVAAMDGVTQPPEYHPEGDVLTHVCLVLDHVPTGDAVLAWSAVLHDVGKPPTWRQAEDRIRFDGHDTLSATMADDILRRLHSSNELRESVVDVCRQHIRFAALPQMRPRRAERWMRSPLFEKHLSFHRADCLGSHGKLEIHDFAVARLAALPPVHEPLLVGRDVLELGIEPGPLVGKLLRAVEAMADASDGDIDRSAALVLLRDMVARVHQGWRP